MSLEEREARRANRGGVVASILNTTVGKDGRGRPKAAYETKQRITLMALPSLYADVQKIAYTERRSVSDVLAELMTQYVSSNQDKLRQYDAASLSRERGI